MGSICIDRKLGFPSPTFPNMLASFYVQAVFFRAFRELETDSMRTSCSERVFVMFKHAPSSLLIPVSMLFARLSTLAYCMLRPTEPAQLQLYSKSLPPVDALTVFHLRSISRLISRLHFSSLLQTPIPQSTYLHFFLLPPSPLQRRRRRCYHYHLVHDHHHLFQS